MRQNCSAIEAQVLDSRGTSLEKIAELKAKIKEEFAAYVTNFDQ